jgi:membrane protein DedA with SNARE-associated domain
VHISLGAALGEAAKRIESIISTGGLIVLGAAVLALVIVWSVRKRRKAKARQDEVPLADAEKPEPEPTR